MPEEFTLTNFAQFSSLPKDLKPQIFKEALIALIKKDENNPKKIIKRLIKLASVNKNFREFFKPFYMLFDYSLMYTDTLLETAIENNWKELYDFIINNIDLSQEQKDNALLWAAINKNQRLISVGADPKSVNITISYQNNTKFNLIESPEITIDKNKELAAGDGDFYTIKYLITNGAYIDAKSYLENTALMNMAQQGRERTIKLLIKYGASINASNLIGKTAYNIAIENGNYKIAEIIKKHNKDNKN